MRGAARIEPGASAWLCCFLSLCRALVFVHQVFQHGIAGVLGLGEGFERRARYPDRATTWVKRTPGRHKAGTSVKAGPERTGIELVDTQSAIHYFNSAIRCSHSPAIQRSVFHDLRNQGNAASANWSNVAIIPLRIRRAKHSVAVEPMP
jgi:hypothetical protein